MEKKLPRKGKTICRVSLEEEQKAEGKEPTLQKELLNKKTVKLLLHFRIGVGVGGFPVLSLGLLLRRSVVLTG